MRPILLSISGLHSFREKQVIDFESLQGAGVFGIFGPTGSGKSSILDAITLALYGKVERAQNNTQGIMNHAENTLSVSFTFEIGTEKTKRRYRVERTYKRADGISVRISVCRLIEIGDREVVLADKEREVTAKIQEILGLTIDDFTRAVVLPQGKFAEFLSLRGSERRKMLERLFHLEKYGEQFNQKLKERLLHAKASVQEIEAAKAELGAASETDVEQARQKCDEAVRHFEQIQHYLAQIEKMHEQQKQIWNLQNEKEHLLAKKAELDLLQPEILELKEKIEKAEEAEKLKPLFNEWKTLLQEVSLKEEEYAQINQKHQTLFQQTETAKMNYEKIKAEYEKNVPILIQNIERYKMAESYEMEYENLKRTRQQLESQYENEQKTYEREWEKLQQAKDELGDIDAEIQSMDTEIAKYTVDPNEKERVQLAVFEKRQLIELQSMLEKLKAEFHQKQNERSHLMQERNEILKKIEAFQQRGLKLFQRIHHHYMDAADLHALAEQHVNKVKRLKENAALALEQKRLSELAHELKAQLKEGEPCPVCGSVVHHTETAKAQFHSKNAKREEDTLKRYDDIIESLTEITIHLSHQRMHLKELSSEVMVHLKNGNIPFEEHVTKMKAPHEAGVEEFAQWIVQTEKLLRQDFIQLQELVKAFDGQGKQINHQLTLVETQLLEKDKLLEEMKNRLTETESSYRNQRNHWETSFKDKSFESIEHELKNLQELEKKRTERMKQFEQLKQKREQINAFISEQTDIVNRAHTNMKIIANDLNRITENLDNLEQKRKEIVGDQSAGVLLEKATEQLENLRTREKAASMHLEKVKRQLENLQNQKISLQEQLHHLAERKDKVSKEWQNQLENSRFQHAAELEQAFLNQQMIEEWKLKISEFDKQWTTVLHDLKRVDSLLQGKSLSENEWEETQRKLAEMKQQYTEAIQLKSEAEYQLKEISEKHKRYLELENELKQAQKIVSQLTKLEAIFRGNAFVEFMAQEQLLQITKDASVRLGRLTNQRYAIEMNSEGGFVIRDDANGGVRRPVSTLSGGETFLTSLALALSLSSHIQLRGKYPLQFFFLDEGFGTLDQEALETVMTSLEKLHLENVSIGIISHVPELKERLVRKLFVHPAEPAGRGTRVSLSS